VPIDPVRLDQAIRIFAAVAPNIRLSYASGFWVSWKIGGKPYRRKWVAKSVGSDYPRWYNVAPFGGTRCRILAHLIRWAKDEPTVPLRVWRYWCGSEVGINQEAARLATEFGWPERVPCVLCGRVLEPEHRLDWYDLDGKRGPGCCYSDPEGCRKPLKAKE